MDGRYLAALSTTVGTIIGAGMLALPYAVSKSGFFNGLILFVLLGIAGTFITLYTVELSFRSKTLQQLPVLISKYTTKRLRWIVLGLQVFTLYGAQIGYLIGLGLILTALVGFPYTISVSVIFLLSLPLVYKGYAMVEDAETPLTIAKIGLIVALIIIVMFSFKTANVSYSDTTQFFVPFGVILFSLGSFSIIPEVKEELGKNKKMLTSVIVAAYVISLALYILFTLAFIGTFGQSVGVIATSLISSGAYEQLVLIFTLFLLITPYIAVSLALTDAFNYDFGLKRHLGLASAIMVPFVIAAISSAFMSALQITGGVFYALLSLLILFGVYESRNKLGKNPAFTVPGGYAMLIFTGAIMAIGMIYTVYYVL